jgi:hypothetical protein
MSSDRPVSTPYSADVRISLEVGGSVYNVAKIGPTRIMVREPVDIGPCDAVLVTTIDGQLRRMQIRLPNGAVPFDPLIAIEVLRVPAAVLA